jgi:hypothetical protein
MQKWDIFERLDEGKSLEEALMASAEYSEYVLDRRLACRQLGMKLPPRISMHRLSETYHGKQYCYANLTFYTTYFERDYVGGIASDKIPKARLKSAEYALKLGRLLGEAAAPNLIVGRTGPLHKVLFDDGDEIVIEDANQLPNHITIADPTGAFNDFQYDLSEWAREYAAPVVRRDGHVPDIKAFSQAYLTGLKDSFQRIQNEYRAHRRAFDSLFKHRSRDPHGGFAYRWEKILLRLDTTNLDELITKITANINV